MSSLIEKLNVTSLREETNAKDKDESLSSLNRLSKDESTQYIDHAP